MATRQPPRVPPESEPRNDLGASSLTDMSDSSSTAAAEPAHDRAPSKGRVLAWALWDWGSASFNAVITTFVFTVYLTSSSFGEEDAVAAQLGWALAIAGVLIAALAPVTGQASDRGGRRRFWLGVHTGIVVAISAALFFVQPDPSYLLLGLVLVAAGNVFFEFASVNYNAMLSQVSTPKNIGRVSGFGWGMGYLGGIVLLAIILIGFVFPEVGWFGVTAENGLNIRVAMLVAAAWFGLFALPVMFAVPEVTRTQSTEAKLGVIGSYRALFARIRDLSRNAPNTLRFLIASAVFRDGLAGVFTFGGIIAARSFGFDSTTVIIFAIAANVVAGVATVALGLADDRLGARFLMIVSLAGMLVVAAFLFFLAPLGSWVFWVFGLGLCVFVGPVQSASRSYLARMIPPGQESEIFGLYATTGRAVSFLAPTAFAFFVGLSGQTITGLIGIALVIAVGLGLLFWVRPQRDTQAPGLQ